MRNTTETIQKLADMSKLVGLIKAEATQGYMTTYLPERMEEMQEEQRLTAAMLEEELKDNSLLRASLRHERYEKSRLEARIAFLYRYLKYQGLDKKARKLEEEEVDFFEEVSKLRLRAVAEDVGLMEWG